MRSLRPPPGVWLHSGIWLGDHTVVLLLLLLRYNKTTAADIGGTYYDMFLTVGDLLKLPNCSFPSLCMFVCVCVCVCVYWTTRVGFPAFITPIRGRMCSVQRRELLNPGKANSHMSKIRFFFPLLCDRTPFRPMHVLQLPF